MRREQNEKVTGALYKDRKWEVGEDPMAFYVGLRESGIRGTLFSRFFFCR
jgi:hypothetical protein